MPKPLSALVLFEDEAALTLEPLSLTRPVWDLQCGIRTLGEKIRAAFPDLPLRLAARDHLRGMLEPEAAGEIPAGALWINGALLPGEGLAAAAQLEPGSAWVREGRVIAFHGSPPTGWQPGTQLPESGLHTLEAPSSAAQAVRYAWDLVHAMPGEIEREAGRLRRLGRHEGEIHSTAVLLAPENVYLGPGSRVAPLAMIDATGGPVVLDDGVQVGPHAVIEGPAYLGPKSQVKPQAHLHAVCSGPECRMGGEVNTSILQSYTNKQHGGFLGHSFLGSWCNLGSGTETSNLKNNYSPVKVQVGDELVDTGKLFVGLTLGDHSKTAIGSVFNTGTVAGVACNLYGAGFPPRYIPSFSWGGAEKLVRYPFNRTLDIARAVMARRGRQPSDAEIEMLRWIHRHRSQMAGIPSTDK